MPIVFLCLLLLCRACRVSKKVNIYYTICTGESIKIFAKKNKGLQENAVPDLYRGCKDNQGEQPAQGLDCVFALFPTSPPRRARGIAPRTRGPCHMKRDLRSSYLSGKPG